MGRSAWVPADTCVAPVNTVAEAVADEQYVARGNVADAVHATEGPFRQSAPIWAGTVSPDGPYEIREGTVTDTAELLRAAGMGRGRRRSAARGRRRRLTRPLLGAAQHHQVVVGLFLDVGE